MQSDRLKAWRSLLLGATNGAIYALVLYLLISLSRAYYQSQYLKRAAESGLPVVQFASNERWSGISIALVLLFTLTAYLVGRVSHFRFHSLAFWALVGVIAVSAWNAFILTVAWLEKESTVQGLTYKWVTSQSNPLYGPISLGLALVVGVSYALAIRFFEKTVPRVV
jgi:hypothetical protein